MRTLNARVRTIGLLGLILFGIAILHAVSAPEKGEEASAASITPECNDGVDNDLDGETDFPDDLNCDERDDEYEGPLDTGIHLTLSDGKDQTEAGEDVTYVIQLSNTRPETLTTDVRFLIPELANLVAASDGGAVHGDSITWFNVTVFPGEPQRITVTARVDLDAEEGQSLVAEVRAAGGARATDTTRVAEETIPADNWTQLSVTDGKVYAQPEDVLTYRILVTNREQVKRKITLRAEVPSQLSLHEVTGPHRKQARKIVWEDLEFGPKETREFFVTGHVERDVPAFFPLRFRISSGKDSATDTTTIRAEGEEGTDTLMLSINDGQQVAVPGQTLEYVIVLENPTDQLITNLDVNAGLPQYAEFVDAAEGGQWTGSSAFWKGLTVSPFGSRELHMSLRVRSDAPAGTVIRAGVVTMGHEAFDATAVGLARIGDGRQTTAPSQANTLSKTADQMEVQPGGTVGFTIRLRNTSGAAWRNVTVVDKFDHALLRVVESADGGQMKPSGEIVWQIPELAPGQVWSTHYVMQLNPRASHGLTITNAVSASGEGMEEVSLTERIYTSSIGVVTRLPKSGAALDWIFVLLTSAAGAGQVMAMHLKRKALLLG